MQPRSSYPPGVPCWLDLVQPDVDATMAFYGDLFGWSYEVRTPPQAPVRYAYARKDDQLVAAVGGPPGDSDPAGWTTYVWVESADDTVAAVLANGGSVLSPPTDIPRAGRVALCADPHGTPIGLWQAGENRGLELVNADGAWNFSELHSPDPEASKAFYGAVFGWECDRLEVGPGEEAWLFRLPGYGEFLAESDPAMREWVDSDAGPEGFADAVAWLEPIDGAAAAGTGDDGDMPRWSVTFAVADAEAALARALELGAELVTPLFDTTYTRASVVRDPQGALLALSEFRPPED